MIKWSSLSDHGPYMKTDAISTLKWTTFELSMLKWMTFDLAVNWKIWLVHGLQGVVSEFLTYSVHLHKNPDTNIYDLWPY